MLLLADADGGEKRTDTDTCSTQVINLINLKRGINLVGTGQNICNSRSSLVFTKLAAAYSRE